MNDEARRGGARERVEAFIADCGPVSVAAISRWTGIPQGSVTAYVAALRRSGALESTPGSPARFWFPDAERCDFSRAVPKEEQRRRAVDCLRPFDMTTVVDLCGFRAPLLQAIVRDGTLADRHANVRKCHYYGVDINPAALESCRKAHKFSPIPTTWLQCDFFDAVKLIPRDEPYEGQYDGGHELWNFDSTNAIQDNESFFKLVAKLRHCMGVYNPDTVFINLAQPPKATTLQTERLLDRAFSDVLLDAVPWQDVRYKSNKIYMWNVCIRWCKSIYDLSSYESEEKARRDTDVAECTRRRTALEDRVVSLFPEAKIVNRKYPPRHCGAPHHVDITPHGAPATVRYLRLAVHNEFEGHFILQYEKNGEIKSRHKTLRGQTLHEMVSSGIAWGRDLIGDILPTEDLRRGGVLHL